VRQIHRIEEQMAFRGIDRYRQAYPTGIHVSCIGEVWTTSGLTLGTCSSQATLKYPIEYRASHV